MRKAFILGILTAILGACASAPAPHMLNLNYSPKSSGAKSEVKVALVKPSFNSKGFASASGQQGAFAAIMNAQLEKATPPDASIAKKYNDDYSFRIKNSMLGDIERVLQAKGFVVTKTFDTFDEITYADKKGVDLLVNPVFDFGPSVANKRDTTTIPYMGTSYSDVGSIKLIGKLKIEMIEPASNERIVIKSLDVGAFGVEAQYKSKEEAENTVIDLINQMYPKMMDKLEAVIDVDEVNHSLADINKLKAKATN